MLPEDKLRAITEQLAGGRAETWETIFKNAANAEQLQTSVEHCNQLEGVDKTARFLVRALGETPLGTVLTHLVSAIDELRGPLAGAQRTPETVLHAVSNEFGVTRAEIVSSSRLATLVLPRQVAAYLMRTVLRISLKDIGEALGGRDHTTVVHSVEKIASRMRRDEAFRAIVDRLMLQLAGAHA